MQMQENLQPTHEELSAVLLTNGVARSVHGTAMRTRPVSSVLPAPSTTIPQSRFDDAPFYGRPSIDVRRRIPSSPTPMPTPTSTHSLYTTLEMAGSLQYVPSTSASTLRNEASSREHWLQLDIDAKVDGSRVERVEGRVDCDR